MLITPICPNVRARPRAAMSSSPPWAVPLRNGAIRFSIQRLSEKCLSHVSPAGPRTRAGPHRPRWAASAGCLDQRVPCCLREPVVTLEVRVRLDRFARAPLDVELVVGIDLTDQARLGDVVVLAV